MSNLHSELKPLACRSEIPAQRELQVYRKIVTGRNTLLVLICWLAFSILLFNFGPYPALKSAIGGNALPEELFGNSADLIHRLLQTLGNEGRELYSRFQVLDAANALLTAVALFFCTAVRIDAPLSSAEPDPLPCFPAFNRLCI